MSVWLQGHTDAVFWQNLNSNTDMLMKNVTIADYLQSLFIYKVISVFQTGLFFSNKFT